CGSGTKRLKYRQTWTMRLIGGACKSHKHTLCSHFISYTLLLVFTKIKSGNHMTATLCFYASGLGEDHLPKFKLSMRICKKGDLIDFNCGMVYFRRLIHWDFTHNHLSGLQQVARKIGNIQWAASVCLKIVDTISEGPYREELTECCFFQLGTGNYGYNSHRLTKLDITDWKHFVTFR
ncbi:hypothetical protein ILYODFUR_028257, partial [Ilyodon furcidens]